MGYWKYELTTAYFWESVPFGPEHLPRKLCQEKYKRREGFFSRKYF